MGLGEIVYTRNISISNEQQEWLKKNPQVNLSGYVRRMIDKLKLSYEGKNCPDCGSSNLIEIHPNKPEIRHKRCSICNQIISWGD